MKHDPSKLQSAERPEPEPPEAKEGWRGADLSEEELVDDDYIAADPDSHVVEEDESNGTDVR